MWSGKRRLVVLFGVLLIFGTAFNNAYDDAGRPSTTLWIIASATMWLIALTVVVIAIRWANQSDRDGR